MDDPKDWPSLHSAVAASRKPRASTSMGIRGESWQRGEQLAEEILRRIQPTAESEERRKAIIRYVQKLFSGILGAEVLPFGSVPLKTYLPDGDIDLTAINCQDPDSGFAYDVISLLHSNEHNKDVEFEVKDVQYINAEVKLVKCLIQNIIVDISFNQIGGVTTFFFLELMDRRIGKDHLFKQSIILIKSWCYYESRILGAHHGLISTYALEMLILHILNIFHKSLYGPLGVLFRFLDYFSKFDWENYCVSLHGPVALSSLPNLVVESPDSSDGDLLLSKEFLKSFLGMLSLPARNPENNSSFFPKKHLNIVDPLRETNNLGRSVSKGNFYRIRSALAYGARKLGEVLTLQEELMANGLSLFFVNTLDRHGHGERPDAHDAFPFGLIGSVADHNNFELSASKTENATTVDLMPAPSSTGFHGASGKEISNIKFYGWKMEQGPKKQLITESSIQYQAADLLVKYPKTKINGEIRANLAWGKHSVGEAQFPSYRVTLRTMIGEHRGLFSGSETECSPARKGDRTSGIPPSINLSGLTGDLELHLTSLQPYYGLDSLCGQLLMPAYQRQPMNVGRNMTMLSQMKANAPVSGLSSSPGSYLMGSSSVPVSHSREDRTKTCGIGTYFPVVSYRLAHGKERNWVPVNELPKADALGPAATSTDLNSPKEATQGPILKVKLPEPSENDQAKSTSLSSPRSPHFVSRGYSQANGFMSRPKGRQEFGSRAPLPWHACPRERWRRFTTTTSPARDSALAPESERPMQSYKLGDDTDFPPLSG